jgi:solute carrier family 25 (mitochondrial S-adenosylmethionine transporter), member 26
MKTTTVSLPGAIFASGEPAASFSMTICSSDDIDNSGSLLLLSGVRARRQQQQQILLATTTTQRSRPRSSPPQFASVTAAAAAPSAAAAAPSASAAPPPSSSSSSKPKLELKPASDVLAGAVARAASQSTVHPLDTLKVRMQAADAVAASSSARKAAAAAAAAAAAKGVAPSSSAASAAVPLKGIASAAASVRSLYAGVAGAASGAGLYIGTYFAFYGAACNLLASATDLPAGAVAFLAGGAGAVGGSVVKVPLAVCIRSVQAGVYPSAPAAAAAIVRAAGVRGLFTGYVPTLLEDVPDMAVKFAVYETLRAAHARLMTARARATGELSSSSSKKKGEPFKPRPPSMGEDFAMGAVAGAAAAAATTPLDVVKTNMMCSAASRPSMREAARAALACGGGRPSALFAGVGPRALSNGINSAVFFAFFSVLRGALAKAKAAKVVTVASASASSAKASSSTRPPRAAVAA